MKDNVTTVTKNNSATVSPEGEKDDDDVYDDNVPLRYRGTSHDKKDMNMFGKETSSPGSYVPLTPLMLC